MTVLQWCWGFWVPFSVGMKEISNVARIVLILVFLCFLVVESWALFSHSSQLNRQLTLEVRSFAIAGSPQHWLNLTCSAILGAFVAIGCVVVWPAWRRMIVLFGFLISFGGEVVLRFWISSSWTSAHSTFIAWVALLGIGAVVSSAGVWVFPLQHFPKRLRLAVTISLCAFESSFLIAAAIGRGIYGGVVLLASAATLGGLLRFLHMIQPPVVAEVFEDEEVLIVKSGEDAYDAQPPVLPEGAMP